MSNYPLQSTYGLPFNSNSHVAPPVGTYGSSMHQYPYQHMSQAPYLHGQSTANCLPPTLHANVYSFNANTQVPPVSNTGVNGNFGVSHGSYGGQVDHTAIPPPPFPPIPIPYGTPSSVPQPSSQPSTISNIPSTHNTLLSKHLDPLASEKAQDTDVEKLESSATAGAELEDGEVNDGDIRIPVNHGETSRMSPNKTSPRKRGEYYDAVKRASSNGHNNISHTSHSLPVQNAHRSYGQHPLSLTQPPQPSTQTGLVGDSPNHQSRDQRLMNRPAQVTPSENSIVLETAVPNIESVTEEAEKALQDLNMHFMFTEIVKEGLIPGDVLGSLYNKFGIELTAASPLLQQMKEPQDTAEDESTEKAPDAATANVLTQRSSSIPITTGVTNHQSPMSDIVTSNINGQPMITVAGADNTSVTNHPITSRPKSTKASSTNLLGKCLTSKFGDTKALDRKEYIARMLAAKAGKSSVSMGASPSSKTATTTDPDLPPSPAISGVIPSTSAILIQTEAATKLDTLQSRKDDADAEAKRKAQTNLARQKIEALKIRESNQHDIQTVSRGKPDVQKTQLQMVQSPPPISVEEHVSGPRSSVPNRQGSYFSPANQKVPFSIPGLFMSSDASESLGSPAQSPSQPPAQRGGVSTPEPAQLDLLSHAIGLSNQLSTSLELAIKTGSLEDKAAQCLPVITEATASGHQKRQKAADFADSPSIRIKRPLGQQQDSSVIIDVSEDETIDSSEEDISDVDVSNGLNGLPNKTAALLTTKNNQKATGDVSLLSDYSPRKKSIIESPGMTPLNVQTLAQAKEPKGLKSKEKEIELMNRKIAQLEQRIKAKQTASRAQTPGTPRKLSVDPVPERPSQDTGPSQCSSGNAEAFIRSSQSTETWQPSLAAAEKGETAPKEQSLVEQLSQGAELAKVTAEAEPKHSRDAEDAEATEEQQEQGVGNTFQYVSQKEQHRQKPEEQRLLDQEQRRTQDEASSQHRDLEQQEPQEESPPWVQDEEDARKRKDEEDLETRGLERRLQEDKDKRIQGKQQRQLLEMQRRLRKADIESGLQRLDAVVDRRRRKLESLRKEIVKVESEVQEGVQGRQKLVEELMSLSQATEALQASTDVVPPDGVLETEKLSSERIVALSGPSSLSEMICYSEPQLSAEDTRRFQDHSTTPQLAIPGPSPSLRCAKNGSPDESLDEDVMDVSRSDVDEGEIPDYSPEPPTKVQNTLDLVDEESYEPPSDIGAIHQHEINLKDSHQQVDAQMANTTLPNTTDEIVEAYGDVANEAQEPVRAETYSQEADMQVRESSQYRNSSLAAVSDPDDYEPPEPVPVVEGPTSPPDNPSLDSEPLFSPSDGETLPKVPRTHSSNGQAAKPGQPLGHFSPYESPLKQFKSYRFHPEYLSEVSNGFRSLTYSHAINPENPICRYEIGGICNDDSCTSQHFRSMGLSDDKILVDLGARPEGSSQEDVKAFGDGLRHVIQDIRSRKVRDFNVVASEITAYRAKFLGDASKVLPL